MTTRTFATANAPESGKRGLLPRRVRALSLLRWAARNRVSVMCVQESGTYLSAAVSRVVTKRTNGAGKVTERRRWGKFYAPPSTVAAGGRRKRGNGVVWDRRDEKRIGTYLRSVPWPDSATGKLWLAVVALEDRVSGKRHLVVSAHAPTRRADRDGSTRRAINRKVVSLAKAAERLGLDITVGADFNDGAVLDDMRGSGLKVAAHHGVDWLLTTGKASDDRTHDLKRARLSDHHAVSARITF